MLQPSWARFLLLIVAIKLGCSAPINLVLLVDQGNELVTSAVKKAATYVRGAEITLATVNVKPNMDGKAICQEIFGPGKAPTLVIEALKNNDAYLQLARDMAIPTVSLSPTLNKFPGEPLTDAEKQYLIQIQPPQMIIPQILKSWNAKSKLPSLLVTWDDSFALNPEMIDTLANFVDSTPKRAYLPITDDSSMAQILSKLYKEDLGNLFIFASVKNINKLIKEGSNNQKFKRQFAWTAITKDDANLECQNCANVSLFFGKPIPVFPQKTPSIKELGLNFGSNMDVGFYFDISQKLGEILHLSVGTAEWPEKLTYSECGAPLEDKADRNGVTLQTALDALTDAKREGIYGMFHLKSDMKYQEVKLEFYNTTINDTKYDSKAAFKYQRKPDNNPSTDLDGDYVKKHKAAVMLRITTVEEPPFVYKLRNPDGTPKLGPDGEELFEGYCIDLIDNIKIQDTLNFEYRIFETKEKVFGEMHPQGHGKNISWSGMIGDLVNDTADIALGPLAVMAERETVVDFTVPYYDLVGISILMKKPEIKSSLFKFLTVLETNVWMCILASYFFTSFLMYLFDRLSPYSFHNNQEKFKDEEEKRDFNMKECLWFCMTSLTPQGGGEAPRNVSGRLVAATWWLFGFIIIASYTANLAAFLTVSRLDSSIESLDDLSKQYKIKYAPVVGSTSQTYFRRMAHIEERFYDIWKNMSLDTTLNETERAKLAVWDYPVSDKYTKIWLTMQDEGFPETLQEGIDRTLRSKGPSEGFALIADSTQVKYATMRYCELTAVGSEFSRKPLALAVQQGHELKDKLSSAILKLLNERKLESLKEAWWTKNPYRAICEDKDKQSDGISIANIGGVFIVIFIGVVLACITLAVEYFYYKGKRLDEDGKVISVKDYGGKEQMKR